MRMNGDQKERARKMVAVPSSWVAPACSGALCAALALCVMLNFLGIFLQIHNEQRVCKG